MYDRDGFLLLWGRLFLLEMGVELYCKIFKEVFGMPYELGGRADKSGNRFEIKWVIYQML